MDELRAQAAQAARELIEKAKLHKGQIVVIGCSTSEICGSRIGSDSRPEVAETVFDAIYYHAPRGRHLPRGAVL